MLKIAPRPEGVRSVKLADILALIGRPKISNMVYVTVEVLILQVLMKVPY